MPYSPQPPSENRTPARPTQKVLKEDLLDGWLSPDPRRAIVNEDWHALQPLHALPHPLLKKISAQFDGAFDPRDALRIIACTQRTDLQLLEFRMSSWRAGILVDKEEQLWICIVGRAKGDHKDYEDFYRRLERLAASLSLLSIAPTKSDKRLQRQEVIAASMTRTANLVQERIALLLRHGGSGDCQIPMPVPGSAETLGTVTLTYTRDECELLVEFNLKDPQMVGSPLFDWALNIIQPGICPDRYAWDVSGGVYVCLIGLTEMDKRAQQLCANAQQNMTIDWDPPEMAHYSHKKAIVTSAIEGQEIQTLCGKYMVQTTAPGDLPVCPTCHNAFNSLP